MKTSKYGFVNQWCCWQHTFPKINNNNKKKNFRGNIGEHATPCDTYTVTSWLSIGNPDQSRSLGGRKRHERALFPRDPVKSLEIAVISILDVQRERSGKYSTKKNRRISWWYFVLVRIQCRNIVPIKVSLPTVGLMGFLAATVRGAIWRTFCLSTHIRFCISTLSYSFFFLVF